MRENWYSPVQDSITSTRAKNEDRSASLVDVGIEGDFAIVAFADDVLQVCLLSWKLNWTISLAGAVYERDVDGVVTVVLDELH